MNPKALRRVIRLLAVAAALCVLAAGAAMAETARYAENEWNFVDESMSTAAGIPRDATGVLGRILRNGVLRVAVDVSNAPRTFRVSDENGESVVAGADAELARLIAERMGVTVRFVCLEATQILPALTEDQCDLALSGLMFTPRRALAYTMSKGYYDAGSPPETGMIIRLESAEDIRTPEDLAGRIIAAESNSLAEAAGVRLVNSYDEFRRLSSAQAVFEAVRLGQADAGLVSVATARTYFKNHPDSGLCLAENQSWAPDVQYLGDRAAAKKGEIQLIAFVNGVIDEVLADGSYIRWMEEAREQAERSGL